ncbi:MAG TPA: methionine--tRNA ligase subunit beta, partial [Candidatus Polarisedimenticolia bacterium]|nr:methionine--tRNA ligase subunit beta [Candidatus Polarisedimenticolia bacterium]
WETSLRHLTFTAGVLGGAAERCAARFRAAFEDYRFHEGLAALWELIGWTNRYIVAMEPWRLAKDPDKRELLDACLYEAAEAMRIVAVALVPVMPGAAQEIWSRLGCPGRAADQGLGALAWGGLKAGWRIRMGAPLFPRIDKPAYFAGGAGAGPSGTKAVHKEKPMEPTQPEKPAPGAATPPASSVAQPDAGTITIDDFTRVKLRVGRILQAERLAGADKLLKLNVDLGDETRTVLAGIALQYAPEALIGKCVIVVANLAPRKMRGVESQGMILAADDGGRPIVATFEPDAPPGAVVR